MQGIHLRNDGLGPHRLAEGEHEGKGQRDELQQPFLPGAQDAVEAPPLQAGEERGTETHRQGGADSTENRHLPGRVAQWQEQEQPGQQCPQWIPGRVGHAEMLGGDDELAGVQQGHIGRRRPDVNGQADPRRNEGRDPIGSLPDAG